MMLYDHCLQRPDTFDLNVHAPLGRGLLLGGFGRFPGTTHYHDSSLYGNSGTLTNMDPATDWLFDSTLGRQGLSNSSGGHVSLVQPGDFISGRSRISIAVWADVYADTARKYILHDTFAGSTTRLRIELQADETIIIGARDASGAAQRTVATPSPLSTGWHHVVGRFNIAGDYLEIFVDGQSAASGSSEFTGSVFDSAVSWESNIFADGNGSNPFVHTLSDLIITDWLTDSEIQQLADPSNVMLSGLILPPTRRFWPVAVSGEETPDLLLPHHGMMGA